MIRFLLFLRKIHFVLLFIVLEAIAVSVFVHSNVQYEARWLSLSGKVTNFFYARAAAVGNYFGLRTDNEQLRSEIAVLRTELETCRHAAALAADTLPVSGLLQYYQYQPVRIIRNRITKRENYIILDQGALQGMQPNMALVSPGGIVGYVVQCSDNYSVAMSVLNTKFRTSGRIQGSDFYGSIYWDGMSFREVILDEIPKYASMAPGDTIVTTEHSGIFPPGVPIGTIADYELINGTFYKLRVRLFADLAQVRNVYAVKYYDEQERRLLENAYYNETAEPAPYTRPGQGDRSFDPNRPVPQPVNREAAAPDQPGRDADSGAASETSGGETTPENTGTPGI